MNLVPKYFIIKAKHKNAFLSNLQSLRESTPKQEFGQKYFQEYFAWCFFVFFLMLLVSYGNLLLATVKRESNRFKLVQEGYFGNEY